jgi:hypothetical protein
MAKPPKPWSPPLVEMSGGNIGHLLEWRQHERDGWWHAWVSWVQTTGSPPRHRHKVVEVRAESLARLEPPEAYRDVPRRVLGNDGKIPGRGRRPRRPLTRTRAAPNQDRGP